MSVKGVYIGTDGGATTTKTGGVWEDGTTVSTQLVQRPTGSEHGPVAAMRGWADGVAAFLETHGLSWAQVRGVGAAMPGPQQSYGVLERGPNLPESFAGFDLLTEYRRALAERAGREVPLVVGNDGNMGGVAEAQRVRGDGHGAVLMLAPGSGLGCAYIDGNGLPLDGDTLAGMEASHMPAPLHLLGGIKAFPCGCGRTWGCVEVYTSLSGLPYLLAEWLPKYPGHPLASSSEPDRKKAFALRGLAQQGDELAVELFNFQAKAMGLARREPRPRPRPDLRRHRRRADGSGRDQRRVPRAVPPHPPRECGPLPLARAAQARAGRARSAGRPVAGDRRGARRAVPHRPLARRHRVPRRPVHRAPVGPRERYRAVPWTAAGGRANRPAFTSTVSPTVTVVSGKNSHRTPPPRTLPPTSSLSPRLRRTTASP